ncbi:hypothetical protein HYDPIDRAFT_27982 [Hydnomerulius pinastri MD-312]|uniref:CxC1-like cysteine cluster associated with KDZ transposases domain-containing protein n=1 Tax=Hydnomerulius pinastri MD-312 TaxID=994086 RepID=A0A0C9VHX8_9AGAM|nr:hypothetical protein HYDPIDRAFT_27982 [Hydnomerulius pinastri MD-312]
MAVSRPRIKKSCLPTKSAQAPESSGPAPGEPPRQTIIVDEALVRTFLRPHKSRRDYLPGPQPVLVMNGHRRFTQDCRPPSPNIPPPQSNKVLEGTELNDIQFSDSIYVLFSDAPTQPRLTNQQKKLNQWRRWSLDVIPTLLPLLRNYLRVTQSLRTPSEVKGTPGDNNDCECLNGVRTLDIDCVFFDRIESLRLRCCSCFTAPAQLMSMGLFACAPLYPSLTVDLRVLKLVKTLFVRIAPNTTAWTEALETFLDGRGYKLTIKNTLSLVDHARSPDEPREDNGQPSEYLRKQCPLCFGAKDWRRQCAGDVKIDCIKRSKNPRGAQGQDPSNPTRSFFIPVHERRPVNALDDEDVIEEGMRIPGVSGYHQHLFVLNLQVRHLDVKSSTASAQWLLRRWKLCQVCKKAAEVTLRVCRILEAELRAQWRAQVEQQTKPSPRRSNNRADDEIARILELEEAVIARACEVNNLEMELMLRPRSHTHDLTADLEDARKQYRRLRNTVRRHREALGVTATASLANLRNNEYLRTRTNALTLKARIRKCLQDRKFELQRIKRSYRLAMNEQRLHTHIESSIQHHQQPINCLVSKYNGLCDDLESLIRLCCAPRGAVALHRIPCEGLFDLDVDDDIWQDVGLADTEADPPAWLSDEDVREGIWCLLQRDRCVEEEKRLGWEHCYLQEWALEEWSVLERLREGLGKVTMISSLQ